MAPSVVFEAPRVPGILLTRRFPDSSGLVGDVFPAIISTDRKPPHKEKGTDAARLAGDFAMLRSRGLADQGGGGGLRRNDRAPRCRNLRDFQTSRSHKKIRKSRQQSDARQKKRIPAKEVRVLRLRGGELRLVNEYLCILAYTCVGLRKCNFSNTCVNLRLFAQISVLLRSRTRLLVNLNISLRNSVRYRALLRNYEYFCIRARTLVFAISRNHAMLREPANKNLTESRRSRAYVRTNCQNTLKL